MIIINGLEMPKENEQLDIVIHPDGKVCYCLDLECKQIATAELVNKDIEYEIDELINPEAYDNYWDEDDEYTNEAEPIVHCEDCRHHEDEELGMVWCPYIVGSWVENDFHCANGEEKEADNE